MRTGFLRHGVLRAIIALAVAGAMLAGASSCSLIVDRPGTPDVTSPEAGEPDSGGSDTDGADTGGTDTDGPDTGGTDTATPPAVCTDLTGEQAVRGAIQNVSPPFPDDPSAVWDYADFTTYDQCLALSYSILSTAGAGAGPHQIMLFHAGVFITQATAINYAFEPQVARLADNAIQVTYTYLQPGESTSEASGKTVMTFTWNDATQWFDVAGTLPPS